MDRIKKSITAGLITLSTIFGCGKIARIISPNPTQPEQYTLDERLARLKPNETLPFSFFYNPEPLTRAPKPAPQYEQVNRPAGSYSTKPALKNIHTNSPIDNASISVTGIEDIGYGLGRYAVKITAPGYEPRETKLIADINAPLLTVDESLVPIEQQVRALYDEAVRWRGGSRRWEYPPEIEVSTSEELTRGAKVTPELIKQITDLVPSDFVSQFGHYAKNAKVRVVPEASWEKNDPKQPGKWPAHPKKGVIIIQYNNFIPGVGSASSADYDKDGYADNGIVSLSTMTDLSTAIRQEVGTAMLFENFPSSLPAGSSVYLQAGGGPSRTFSPSDTKTSHWGFNRPGLNAIADKDDGWKLTWQRNANGLYLPSEARLLLNGPQYAIILLPGDFPATLNNVVDFDDFFGFAYAFNSTNPAYDLNGDGRVDFDDFFLFAENFGRVRRTPGASKLTLDTRISTFSSQSPNTRLSSLARYAQEYFPDSPLAKAIK